MSAQRGIAFERRREVFRERYNNPAAAKMSKAIAARREELHLASLCSLCSRTGCVHDLSITSCVRFTAPQCERCETEHPDRACSPPSCLGEEVRS